MELKFASVTLLNCRTLLHSRPQLQQICTEVEDRPPGATRSVFLPYAHYEQHTGYPANVSFIATAVLEEPEGNRLTPAGDYERCHLELSESVLYSPLLRARRFQPSQCIMRVAMPYGFRPAMASADLRTAHASMGKLSGAARASSPAYMRPRM